MIPLLFVALLPLDVSPPGLALAAHSTRPAASPRFPPRLVMDLRATIGPIRDGAQVSIAVKHRWHGDTPERFLEGDRGACAGPQDYLLVDGKPRSLVQEQVCDGPWAPSAREIAPGGAWTSVGEILLTPGRHRLRAVYRVDKRQADLLGRADNMIVYRGEVRSPELVLDIPRPRVR